MKSQLGRYGASGSIRRWAGGAPATGFTTSTTVLCGILRVCLSDQKTPGKNPLGETSVTQQAAEYCEMLLLCCSISLKAAYTIISLLSALCNSYDELRNVVKCIARGLTQQGNLEVTAKLLFDFRSSGYQS